MAGEHISVNQAFDINALAEIYGENTAYVSAKDIEQLKSDLSPEDFAKLSKLLGWDATGAIQ